MQKTHDKPKGEELGWKRLATSFPYSTPWLRIRQDRIRVRDQSEDTFTYVDIGPAISIVPVTSAGEVILMRQYRYTVDEWLLEVPAGGTHDKSETPLGEVAREELKEEVGATCDEILYVGCFYTTPGNSSQALRVFLALGVALNEKPQPGPLEQIERCPTPVGDALRMARNGEIKDGASALPLLLCEGLLKQRGLV